ncbi:hypothetical protein EBT23_06435 [bacterium]|nr:hypothetical protein [bacterium]
MRQHWCWQCYREDPIPLEKGRGKNGVAGAGIRLDGMVFILPLIFLLLLLTYLQIHTFKKISPKLIIADHGNRGVGAGNCGGGRCGAGISLRIGLHQT